MQLVERVRLNKKDTPALERLISKIKQIFEDRGMSKIHLYEYWDTIAEGPGRYKSGEEYSKHGFPLTLMGRQDVGDVCGVFLSGSGRFLVVRTAVLNVRESSRGGGELGVWRGRVE